MRRKERGQPMTEPDDSSLDRGIRGDALQVLEYILKLELAPARWERLAGLIEIAIDAEAAGDTDGLRQATIELELAGPVRVIRIGDAPAVPPPPRVRERVNYLVHELRTAGAAAEGEDDR
jgi:hypothetical protein